MAARTGSCRITFECHQSIFTYFSHFKDCAIGALRYLSRSDVQITDMLGVEALETVHLIAKNATVLFHAFRLGHGSLYVHMSFDTCENIAALRI